MGGHSNEKYMSGGRSETKDDHCRDVYLNRIQAQKGQ